jgi:hypothetical protein
LPTTFRSSSSVVYRFDSTAARIVQDAADQANHEFGLKAR